jgi:acyl dehydratase
VRVPYTAGALLPTLAVPSITAVQVAFMIVANNDTADIHVDEAAARRAGLPRTVVPGSFVLGHIGRLLEQLCRLTAIRTLDVRFRAAVFTGDALNVGGCVDSVNEEQGVVVASFNLWVRNAEGATVATGTARVASI